MNPATPSSLECIASSRRTLRGFFSSFVTSPPIASYFFPLDARSSTLRDVSLRRAIVYAASLQPAATRHSWVVGLVHMGEISRPPSSNPIDLGTFNSRAATYSAYLC